MLFKFKSTFIQEFTVTTATTNEQFSEKIQKIKPILIRGQDYGTSLFPFDKRVNKKLEEKCKDNIIAKSSDIKTCPQN